MKTGYLILFARKTLPEAVHYREDNDFFYYTGISDPGAVLVMDCAKSSAMIFEPQQAPRTKQVYGANLLSLAEEERKKLGFETVLPLDVLDRLLAYGLMRSDSSDCGYGCHLRTRRMERVRRLVGIMRRSTRILMGTRRRGIGRR